MPEPSEDERYLVETVVMICRPVDWEIVTKMTPDLPEAAIIEGSIVAPCMHCRVDIYIGPVAQETMRERPDAQALCFGCSWRVARQAMIMKDPLALGSVRNLLESLKGKADDADS